MDKISIVVAVYNAENTLKKCIDSLLSQTYGNTEIILVNDCSQDESLNICNEYASENKNVIVVNNPQNQGVSATRNNGIDVASGKYICFVDSDDYVENNYLEQLHYYAEKYNTVPICGFTYHDEFNHKKPVKYQWSGGDELVSLGEAFQLRNQLYLTALWNKLFCLKTIKDNHIFFDTKLSLGEDLRFSVEYFNLSRLNKVYALSETLYHYTRLTNNTLMSDFGKAGIETAQYNLALIRDLAIQYNNFAEEIYQYELVRLKLNFTYRLMSDESLTRKERLKYIRLYNPEFSNFQYALERLKILKQKTHKYLNRFRK